MTEPQPQLVYPTPEPRMRVKVSDIAWGGFPGPPGLVDPRLHWVHCPVGVLR